MNRDRWRRIEQFFHDGAALPENEWPGFLAQLPADEDLRAEVLSLLQSNASRDDPVVEVVEHTLQQAIDEGSVQQTFGPYRIVHKLSGGSQADVYMAERTDGEYRTKVAIKVAKRGFPTEDLRRRFRQERQILASLRHANIARLLDGGTTDDGLPFLVMEFVDGESIDTYCDGQRLSINERLLLFRSVCSAVEHAHRNLTIHRDLKPSNILVATDGRPILLDFGIAKLLAEPELSDAPLRTVEGLRFLTPAYASPEQVLGEPLTTSTDVYSLGVVLYQLLAGCPPYEIEGLEPKALYEQICDSRPLPPSRSLGRPDDGSSDDPQAISAARGETPSGLRQRLKGDLDTIVLKALRKEPSRRYVSVTALVEDIDRFLARLPIRAQKDTASYRVRKLIQRHPYGVAATVALMLAILVGVSSTLRATWQARAERDRAQVSQVEAERVTRFMVGLFEVASPEISLGEEVSAVEVLNRGAELIGDELDEQPISRARLLRAMGQAYHGLGLYERAAELFRESISDREQVLGPSHLEVAESLLDLARSAVPNGDYSEAETTLERSLEICTRVGPAADQVKASTYNLLAQIRQRQGDIEQAEELYRDALKLHTEVLGADHLVTLESLNDLGEALSERRMFAEAGKLYRDALAGQRRQRLPESHPDVLKTLSNLATAQLASGDFEGAEATMRDVVKARRRLYGEDHPHVALAYSNLGQVLSSQGKNEEALGWLEQALDLSIEHYGDGHPRIADLLYNLGFVLEELDRLDEAERRMIESRTLLEAALGDQHPEVAQSLVALAGIHHRQGRTRQAIAEARQSHQILQAALPADDYRQSSPVLQLGLLLTDDGRCDEARSFLDQAVALRRKVLPEGHPALAAAVAARLACH